MALWDYHTSTRTAEEKASLVEQEAHAQGLFGHVPQIDWWTISATLFQNGFERLEHESTLEFLIEASPDVRHVAVLTADESHLDPYDLFQVFEKAPCDKNTFLAYYAMSLAELLEFAYQGQAAQKVVKDGKAHFDNCFTEDEIVRIAGYWRDAETSEFAFDIGRKLTLYKLLEDELQSAGLVPDWFIPSEELHPKEGRQADSDVILWDYDLFKIPPSYERRFEKRLPALVDTGAVGLPGRIASLFGVRRPG